MTIILFIIVLFLVVTVHEAGHFYAAKKMGMRVKEFAFGFPPKLFGIKKGETEYSFNLIPLGGYVAIDGENGKTDEEIAGDSRLFTAKSKLAQAIVLFAGPFMNFVLAFVLLSMSYMIGYGNNKTANNLVILGVLPGSVSENYGLKEGDIINAVSSTVTDSKINNPKAEDFQNIVKNSNGQELDIEIKRGNDVLNIKPVPLLDTASNEYKLGVSIGTFESKKLGFFTAIKTGFMDTAEITWGTIKGLGQIIASLFGYGDIKGSVSGPVGIAKQVGVAANFGFAFLLNFITLISINLGVINLFPFPALDGGRLLFLLIEKIKGSRISAKTTNIVNAAGFGILILLMIIVTIKDVIKLF